MLDTLDSWHKTKTGYLVFVVLELSLVYLFASLSISHGNLWFYLLTLLFLAGAVQNFWKLMTSFGKVRRVR